MEGKMHSFKTADLQDKIFIICNYIFLTLVTVIVLLPLIFIVSASFSDPNAVINGKVWLLPVNPTLKGYQAVFKNPKIMIGFANSFFYMISGTTINIIVTVCCAYPLTRKEFPARNVIAALIIFTMYFSGGIIPSFVLYNWLGLYDSYLVYILPALFGGFYNVIIFNANFKAIPESLFESAKLDGADEWKIYASVVLPLSKPVLTALGVFTACGIWNDYSATLFFTQSASLQTLGSYTLKLVKSSQAAEQLATSVMQSNQQMASLVNSAMGSGEVTAKTIELASMVLTALPVIIAYPFAQKFFAKGVMIGSVKG